MSTGMQRMNVIYIFKVAFLESHTFPCEILRRSDTFDKNRPARHKVSRRGVYNLSTSQTEQTTAHKSHEKSKIYI